MSVLLPLLLPLPAASKSLAGLRTRLGSFPLLFLDTTLSRDNHSSNSVAQNGFITCKRVANKTGLK